MKAAELSSALSALSLRLREWGAETASGAVQDLAALLARYPRKSVAQLAKSIVRQPESTPDVGGATAREVAGILTGLRAFLDPIIKKGVATDFDELVRLLQRFGDAPLAALGSEDVASASPTRTRRGAAPVDQVLIDNYLTRLQAALGDDDSFMELYKELHDDKRVNQKEAVRIADRFMGPVPPSTSRPKALQRILSRHRKLMGFEAGSASIGERLPRLG